MPDFTLRKGDTASPLESVLVDDTGAAVGLNGATVELALAPAGGGTLVVDYEPADIVSPAAEPGDPDRGRVRYGTPWQAGEVDTAGLFLAEWRVTYGTGEVQTFPNDGYLVVEITEDVGAVTVGDLLELHPDLDPARAATMLALARRVLTAAAAPATLPAGDRLELLVLRVALQLASSRPDAAGAVVSESLGSYTYRLARPSSLVDVLALDAGARAELDALLGRGRVYSIDTTPSRVTWPLDWWARDYDTLEPDEVPAVPPA